ncbi:hypothetical protein PV08_01747 [Exophiala spinifera]|uniref:Uncharacterized protein n=1 Tax=Exophiala spinifera TaxID=91928 RepID=A0A0D2A8R3_9EURO|nr:uncharacterized protein PV08_01747 [Exophiala spinifera]KIW21167.1 hypothetical protein PV08_01747 [Exophiala spinifera]
MAVTKPAYDPLRIVEGMFNGSVTRIAYAMKDPVNYAQSTRAVLVETAKKFQDALDDCEVQILDAKWYLENKLAQNRARREAKAKEDSAATAKRKRDEVEGAQEKTQEAEQETASKRVKTAEPDTSVQTQPQPPPPPKPKDSPPKPSKAPAKPQTSPKIAKKTAPAKPAEKQVAPTKPDNKKSQSPSIPAVKAPAKMPEKPFENPPPPVSEPKPTPLNFDDFAKATPQDMSAGGNEDFNFTSMFGEPSTDMMTGSGNDMNFDMNNLGDGFDASVSQDTSLNSLLPGLESYANQAGDDTFNMPPTDNNVSSSGNAPADASQPAPLNPNDFSLPALGPNEFDELLNSSDMNFDDAVNFDSTGMMNMDNMDSMDNMESMENMDLDFDSMFA